MPLDHLVTLDGLEGQVLWDEMEEEVPLDPQVEPEQLELLVSQDPLLWDMLQNSKNTKELLTRNLIREKMT